MVKTRDEILAAVNALLGENPDTAALDLLGDIADTLDAGSAERVAELEKKVADVEAEWKRKYRERFFDKTEETETVETTEEDPEEKEYTYESLFTEEKEEK